MNPNKTCQVCQKEIKPSESYKGDGLGYTHLKCIFTKPIKPGILMKTGAKVKDDR